MRLSLPTYHVRRRSQRHQGGHQVNNGRPFGLTVSMLRAVTDFAHYMPDSSAPSWLQILGQIASHDAGALAIAGPSGLTVDIDGSQLRAMPDAPSMFITGLVDRLRGTDRRLALGMPPAARHLPLLIAASTVLANVIDRASKKQPRGDGSVLILSPDLEVRSRYCDLCVEEAFIDEAYPGSRMRPDGHRTLLQPKRDALSAPGVCFFLPGLSLPTSINLRPALILVDLRYGRWVNRASDLAQWAVEVGEHAGIVALYTIGDLDTQNPLLAHGFDDFPLDHSAVAACVQHVTPTPSTSRPLGVDWSLAIAPDYLAREHEVVLVSNGGVVEGLIRDIDHLLYKHAQIDAPELRRARWLLALLNHLPMPLVTYEYSARALGRSQLKHMIDRLDSRPQGYNAALPALKRLRELFTRLYDVLWKANPRTASLCDLLPKMMSKSEGEQVLVLVRDRVIERAFQDWVALEAFPDATWLPRLDIRAYPTYFPQATRRYAQVLVNGAFSRRYKWIIGAALGAQVTFLSYAHEIEVIQRQLESAYGELGQITRARTRFDTAAQLSGGHAWAGGTEAAIASLVLRLPQTQMPSREVGASTDIEPRKEKAKDRPQMTLTDLGQLAGAFHKHSEEVAENDRNSQPERWVEDAEEDEPFDNDATEDDVQLSYGPAIACRRLIVNSRAHGRGIVWLDQYRLVEIFRPSNTDALQMTKPDSIRTDDVLLLSDDSERMNLFDRIVQLAEGQPRLRYLTVRRRAWQEAVHHMVAYYRNGSDVDYEAVLRALRRNGATITSTQAVRSWVENYVIGPESINSIIAVGRVSRSDTLVRSAREFDLAFREIRGIRQGIGMRLSNAIRRSFSNFAQDDSASRNAVLDNRLGIALDELLDVIDLAVVISVGDSLQSVAPYRVGRFLQK